MSKLLIAIVRTRHVGDALDALVAAGHRVTAFDAVGGFLREDSRALMLAVEDGKRSEVVQIFERTCPGEEVEVPLVLMERLKDWEAATVHHAGATIFVLPLDEIIRT